MNLYTDKENKFFEVFNPDTGFYMRSGVIEDGKDTGIDPFMRNSPSLLDVGIMGSCIHGKSGLCVKSGIQCYQDGLNIQRPNMAIEDFKSIVDQSKGKVFQIALGGRGDVNKYEHFEEALSYCRENGIVPNFTTSGLGLTESEVAITAKFVGAVAISEYRSNYTRRTIKMMVDAGVKTNIHYVLADNTIDEAIDKLKNNGFDKGINAVIFLMHKPIGLGSQENMLKFHDPRVKEFFALIDGLNFDFKVGFDSCSCAGIVNFTKNIAQESMDYCESSRMSGYIDAEMNMMPCSFCNQNSKYFYNIKGKTIQDAWDSQIFQDFRDKLKNGCKGCSFAGVCSQCPVIDNLALCERNI